MYDIKNLINDIFTPEILESLENLNSISTSTKDKTVEQLNLEVEELNELAVSISHLRRNRDNALASCFEEFADVLICLNQFLFILQKKYDLSGTDIQKTIDYYVRYKTVKFEKNLKMEE